MNKLNCGIKILYPAFLIQAIGFAVITTYYPSFIVPMTVGAFLIWFSIQVDILYQCWMYPAKYIEYNNRPIDWIDEYEVVTEGSGCGWENVYQEEKEREEWDEECFGNYATDPIHDEPIMDGPKNYGDVYETEDYLLKDDDYCVTHGPSSYEDIEIDDDEDDDDIIRPDLSHDVVVTMPEVTLEELMKDYKEIGEEYSRQYKENLAKELERTGLSEQEYFKACFGDDVGRKLDDKVS